jgi:small-conductance mechanosensitive channel
MYSLYGVHAEVIRDAVSQQMTEIESQLRRSASTRISSNEKNRLKNCLQTRRELLSQIMKVLNQGSGAIKFEQTPNDYYSRKV